MEGSVLVSKLLSAARHLGAGLVAALVLLGSGPAAAQAWVTATCSSCHGAPPSIAASVADNSASFVIGLGEAWMASAADLRTRVQAAGASQGVAAMQNISVGDANEVYAYFLQLRDGAVGSFAPSFSTTAVGSSSTSAVSFTISNYREDALTYTLGTSTGNAGEFTVQTHSVTGTGCTAGNVPATASTAPAVCTVDLTLAFTPGGAGTRTTNFTVDTTSPSNPQPSDRTVVLSGDAFVPTPIFQISTTTLNFSTKVGTTTTNALTISNSGSATANLVINSLTFPAGYSRASGCDAGTSLAPGGSCLLTINFSPSLPGATNGNLSIDHNAAGSPQAVALNGTGTVPTLALSASALDFGNSQTGVPKALPAITLSNTGAADLVFSVDPGDPAALGGDNPADFSVSDTCGATLLAGQSCTVTGTFTPTATGSRSATLTISSDASNGAQVIALGGNGVALPEPVVTFPTIAFPDTVIGESGAQTRQLTISNGRTRAITYSVAETDDFKIDAESCATRTVPGDSGGGPGSCTVTWRFQPTLGSGEGNRQATITVTFGGTGGDPAPGNASGQLGGRALLPIALSATTLNTSAVVGTPATSSVLVTNRSASGVTLGSLAFSGSEASDYTLAGSSTCTAGALLAAGANCTLAIRFDPPAAGTRNAVLTITHGAPGSPQTVTITGTATPAPQGRIELSALALSFPDTQLGATATRAITVRNNGNLALTFSAFTLAGTHAADFQRGGTCSTATPLAIGAQCTLSVGFVPTALGARSATLTIQSDASNGAATITLAGTGVPVPAPQVSLTPASIDFGVQTVGGLYPGRSVRLDNSGTADLALSAIAAQGAGFAADATACPATLAPGDGCDIVVGFAPASAGTDFTGTLRVTSNAAGSPHSVTLRGRGSLAAVPVLVWSPAVTTLDFGNVSTGTVSAVQSATLLNQGPGGVTLNLLNAVGPGAASFSVAGGTCQAGQTLFQGETCRVDVSFAPAAAGVRTATVQVASDGSAPPALTLRGTGLGGPAPALSLSQATLAFDATRVGDESLPGELTLRSTGSGALRVTALVVSGPFVVAPKSCPGVPFVLPAGGECTLAISFVPDGEGALSGTLRVDVDADPASAEVALSGRGEPKADLSSGGGGCSLARGDTLVDPTLWTLVLLAAAVLLARRRARRTR